VEGQVGVGTTSPNASAVMELNSTSTGFLPPRITTAQMNAINSPAEGLTIYNTTLKTLCWFNGTSWTYVPQDGKSCGTISYDGKTYETVIIGFQCWMKQNLNIGKRIDGIVEQTNNDTIEKYCYNDDEANCDVYGGLYQWDEMMNYTASSSSNPSGRQGICPTGWHVSSDAEWCQMETYLEATVNCTATGWWETDLGGKLKETGTNHWASNSGATNSSGFTALGPGFWDSGAFYHFNESEGFWTATESDTTHAWQLYLYTGFNWLAHNSSCVKTTEAYSIRCVKD
jgi:uncharacterized protein (TIGR02145 family)